MKNQTTNFSDTKPHYHILDGLRGVAALIVLCFHVFEGHATSHLDQRINHGYLAVDFFFILSGFVIGYAYDDRWNGSMNIKSFIKRRLIRLHPMVVAGSVIGALLYYTQDWSAWNVSTTSLAALLFATVMGALLLPSSPSFEVRGSTEMFPLNGPSWSLFFEYIGNLLYAFVLRFLPTRLLAVWVFFAACALAAFSITGPFGDVCAGWTLEKTNLIGGSLRLLFAFSAGLLLSRVFKPVKIRGSFWICSFIILVVTTIPRIGGAESLWMNGIYDAVCIVFVFPLIVFLGASGKTTDKISTKVCNFLGDLSFPLYMVHYPLIYIYFAWVNEEKLTFAESYPGGIALIVVSVTLAYLCLKFYDEPVRRYLSKRLLRKKS